MRNQSSYCTNRFLIDVSSSPNGLSRVVTPSDPGKPHGSRLLKHSHRSIAGVDLGKITWTTHDDAKSHDGQEKLISYWH